MLILPNSSVCVKKPRAPSVIKNPRPNEIQPEIKSFGLRNEIASVAKMTTTIAAASLKLSAFTDSITSERMNCDEKVRRFSPSKFQCP